MPPGVDISVFGLTLLVMLIGLFGLIVPVFPGMLVIWLAALGYGMSKGFTLAGWILFILITILALVGSIVDNIFTTAGARRGGASWWSILLATIAGLVGTFMFPPLGGVIAAPLAVLVVEYLRSRNLGAAFTALKGLATGWGLSFLARFGIGIIMVLLWVLWAFVSN